MSGLFCSSLTTALGIDCPMSVAEKSRELNAQSGQISAYCSSNASCSTTRTGKSGTLMNSVLASPPESAVTKSAIRRPRAALSSGGRTSKMMPGSASLAEA